MINDQVLLSDDFLRSVMEGLREYNRNSPPQQITFVDGRQLFQTERQKAACDAGMVQALRHGMKGALARVNNHGAD